MCTLFKWGAPEHPWGTTLSWLSKKIKGCPKGVLEHPIFNSVGQQKVVEAKKGITEQIESGNLQVFVCSANYC